MIAAMVLQRRDRPETGDTRSQTSRRPIRRGLAVRQHPRETRTRDPGHRFENTEQPRTNANPRPSKSGAAFAPVRPHSLPFAAVRLCSLLSGRPDSNRGPRRPESLGQVAWFPQNACKGAGSGYACRLQLVRYFLGYEGIWAVEGPSLPELLVLGSGDRRTSQPLLIAAGLGAAFGDLRVAVDDRRA